jgi:hypothetical protein
MSRHGGSFRVVPRHPSYVLRSPDSRETPFAGILHAYNGSDPAQNWMDLRPLMELRIENAYYKKGASRRGLAGFLGTEVARYDMTPDGLRLLSFHSMNGRPEGDVPVEHLITAPRMTFPYQRLYFEIVFSRKDNSHGSVLLGANSTWELDRLSAQLSIPETVCSETSSNCTVFPEACTVSVEMEIVLNGQARDGGLGSLLDSVVAEHPQHLEMQRLYDGQLRPVKIDPHDSEELLIPLLPGDRVSWK